MHELFAQVLTKRDLSRAGDLFLLDDKSISDDLSKVLSKIQEITSASEFVHSDNDQSVVEISITRVTSAIRDTGTIDQHAAALVSLLESCLNHDLRPSPKDEDPPHAKITSDLVSCIFMNHNKKAVMKLALPIAVKFLHRGNKELSRNLSSYLSLAAINNAELLSPHIQPIIDSIIGGNYSLARVLPQIYVVKKEPIHDHVMALVSLLPQCENQEKLSLLSLFALIAKHKPFLLESNLPQLSECLTIASTSATVLQIFLDMSFVRPLLFTEHIQKIKAAAELQSGMLPLAAKLLGVIGKLSLERGRDCLDFLVAQLGKADHTAIHGVLREIRSITDIYPSLLSQALPHITTHLESSSSSTARMYLQQLKADLSVAKPLHMVNQTPGGVTIVKVGGSKQDVTLIGNTHHQPVTSASLSQPPSSTTAQGRSIIIGKENRINVNTARLNQLCYPDSRSLTQLGSLQAVNRSMSRLPNSGSMSIGHQSTSCLGHPIGLHTSMTRLVPSVVNRSMTAINSRQNLNGVPFAKISSGGVTVTTATSISSHKSITGSTPTLQDVQPSVVMVSINSSTQTAESSSSPPSLQPSYSVSMTSATPSSPVSTTSTQEIVTPSNSPSMACLNNVPSPAAKLRANATRVTMNSNDGMSVNTQRISVFEPYPMRDAIQHFCEKHLDKIKGYMEKVFVKIPLPAKCTIEERKAKKHAKLHFACQGKGEHCLYSKNLFLMKTRNPRIWIHLMFLALQARASSALSTREASVSSLKNCWDTLKADTRTFLTLVTSAFPSAKDQDLLIGELRNAGFLAMFEYNAPQSIWGCFLCNHPDRAQGFLQEGAPVIEGQLKEKKGKWKLFRRWRTRYFTLSGAHLSYKGVVSNANRNNFRLLESQWTAAEEIKLLDAIVECGIGNWYDIACLVGSKSKDECQSHYLKCYIYNPQNGLLEPPKPEFINKFWANPVPFKVCDEPPHPSTSSTLFKELVGYMPGRGDFGVEYDNYAELDVRDIDFENGCEPVEEAISLAVLDAYNKRMKARAKRKWIIREHGLISKIRTLLSTHRYNKTFGAALMQRMLRFSKFLSVMELDFLFEGWHKEEEVKQKILRLQEYRSNGLTKHHNIPTYCQLKERHDTDQQMKRTALTDVLSHVMSEIAMKQWLHRQAQSRTSPSTPLSAGRRTAPPLDVTGLPGIEKLDTQEKELCSVLRLIPNVYLQFKALLIQECEKLGGLKLSHARSLIKIDVNKTRKVYDFLLKQGNIHKM